MLPWLTKSKQSGLLDLCKIRQNNIEINESYCFCSQPVMYKTVPAVGNESD